MKLDEGTRIELQRKLHGMTEDRIQTLFSIDMNALGLDFEKSMNHATDSSKLRTQWYDSNLKPVEEAALVRRIAFFLRPNPVLAALSPATV
ncbi:MAG: hypothetical protein JWL80_198 [Parcubacteria group bacterium]|nr:hypothetical protein [Parcubacteria group bacterium]